MNQTYMKEKPVFPLILTMSLPMVLSMLVNALYNIVDSYFVAQISEEAMTALSLVYPLQNLVTAVGVGFGIGINAAVAYYLGAQRTGDAEKSFSQGLFLSALHGIILTLGCICVMPLFLRLFTSSETVISYGLGYSNVVFLFSVVITVEVTYEKLFQAVGMMKVSMISMLVGCVVNIILDPLFIFGAGFIPAMGVEGAALATGIGQAATLVIYLVIYRRVKLPVKFRLNRNSLLDRKICKRLYGVGIPATLNLALASLLITALNRILSGFSQMYVLILGIYYKLQTFIYLTANGIVQGIRPLVSYNYGAGRNDRVRSIHKTALFLGLVIMAVGTGLCMIIPDRIIGLFTHSPETARAGALALRIISCGFIVSTVSVMTSGTFEGLGKGLPSLIISLIRYIAIIPIAFVLSLLFGAVGVWHAFWVTELIAAGVSVVLFFYSFPLKQ